MLGDAAGLFKPDHSGDAECSMSYEEFLKTGSFSFPKAAAMFVILGVLFGTLFTTAMMLFDYLESGSAEAGNVSWLTVGVSTGAAFGLMFVIAYAVIYRLKK